MLNPRLKQLPDHTWDQLRALLDPRPAGRADPLSLTIGAPQHPMPGFVLDILDQERAGYSKYPPIVGTPAWQDATVGWLTRRYGLTDIDPALHLLPVSGTREGLFNAAFIAIPKTKAGQQPAVHALSESAVSRASSGTLAALGGDARVAGVSAKTSDSANRPPVVGAGRRLAGDDARVLEPLQDRVQVAGQQADLPLGALFDALDDGVAVALAVIEYQQHRKLHGAHG